MLCLYLFFSATPKWLVCYALYSLVALYAFVSNFLTSVLLYHKTASYGRIKLVHTG